MEVKEKERPLTQRIGDLLMICQMATSSRFFSLLTCVSFFFYNDSLVLASLRPFFFSLLQVVLRRGRFLFKEAVNFINQQQ